MALELNVLPKNLAAIKDGQAYRLALEIVAKSKEGLKDDVGDPRLLHFERVAERLVALFPEATPGQIQAALLHDIFRDGFSIGDLRQKGVEESALAIIGDLMPDSSKGYMETVQHLADNAPLETVQVRFADNQENIHYYEQNRHLERANDTLNQRCYPAEQVLKAALSKRSK